MSWLKFESGSNADGTVWLTATPKRWYALYPSYWRMVIRALSLMPTAPNLED